MIVVIPADDDSAKKRVETLLESFGYSVDGRSFRTRRALLFTYTPLFRSQTSIGFQPLKLAPCPTAYRPCSPAIFTTSSVKTTPRVGARLRATMRTCSRSHACAASFVRRGCQLMKQGNGLSSRGGSIVRKLVIRFVIFARV